MALQFMGKPTTEKRTEKRIFFWQDLNRENPQYFRISVNDRSYYQD